MFQMIKSLGSRIARWHREKAAPNAKAAAAWAVEKSPKVEKAVDTLFVKTARFVAWGCLTTIAAAAITTACSWLLVAYQVWHSPDWATKAGWLSMGMGETLAAGVLGALCIPILMGAGGVLAVAGKTLLALESGRMLLDQNDKLTFWGKLKAIAKKIVFKVLKGKIGKFLRLPI